MGVANLIYSAGQGLTIPFLSIWAENKAIGANFKSAVTGNDWVVHISFYFKEWHVVENYQDKYCQ